MYVMTVIILNKISYWPFNVSLPYIQSFVNVNKIIQDTKVLLCVFFLKRNPDWIVSFQNFCFQILDFKSIEMFIFHPKLKMDL